MSALVKAWCACGWHGEYDSPARADFARRRHSCDHWQAKRERARRKLERKRNLDRTERPCTHKIASHEHGTYERFTLDHCHCDPCRDAKRAYESERRRRKAYGHEPYVDARPAAEHVRALMAADMGWKRVAAAAGIAESNVYVLLYGRPDRNGGKPRTKARKATVDAILAVPMPGLDDYADHALRPAVGTRRRLQALQSVGWSVAKIAERSGVERQALDGALNGRHWYITAAHARAVRDAYDALWDTAPPEDAHQDKIAAARSRNKAARAGWPMPLELELIDVDDPTAPEPVRASAAEMPHADDRLDEWLFLVRSGETLERAARRVGYHARDPLNTIRTVARRHDRVDITSLLDQAAAERAMARTHLIPTETKPRPERDRSAAA